ncbi:hypothetical protein [Luteimonas kalidii]|uniref:SGNH/GDSL hydrolase family protein n=1 Tax=Luteimonas kalidii TaxID=3042025 RepID=A0ABT6JP24_9GAMM|nr:hypothetical protein [Luteimonas kalidii]MDH5832428.1 hypothetical protein [Luteimonas kalidii]
MNDRTHCTVRLSRVFLATLLTGLAAVSAHAAPARLAVVGDSDSHAYHDRMHFTGTDGKRGGEFHATTWQWTEALHRLRGRSLDQGPWDRHGLPGTLARAAEWAGLPVRPAKEDFEYNFAMSGARCESLMGGERQVPTLVGMMDQAPERWRGGYVVVRIGVNSFGQAEHLHRLAADRDDPHVSADIDSCIAAVRESVAAIHGGHPATRIVLVGIFDNSNVAGQLDVAWTPRQLANIAAALDRYDDALRAMAQADRRIAFFDDRAWFAALWGTRAPSGAPAYRDVRIGRLRVRNAQGDEPTSAVLGDGHAGSAWNALWSAALVALLDREFDAGIAPVSDAELAALMGQRASPAGD